MAAIWSINIATGLSPRGKVRLLVNSPLPRQEVASLPFSLLWAGKMHLEPGSGQWSLPDWGNGPAAAAGGTQGACVLVRGCWVTAMLLAHTGSKKLFLSEHALPFPC